MLEIRGLNVAYGESQVLWDVSLEVPDRNPIVRLEPARVTLWRASR